MVCFCFIPFRKKKQALFCKVDVTLYRWTAYVCLSHEHDLGSIKLVFSVMFVLQEARCMMKARILGAAIPSLYAMDTILYTLTFEFVEGVLWKRCSWLLAKMELLKRNWILLLCKMGSAIGKFHDGVLIHGDLTSERNQSIGNAIVSTICRFISFIMLCCY